ncbi:MAG: SPFH domain-containing protein [Singulisphaera sp.]
MADARVVEVDLREAALDVGGQEIMTADKVTLRLNALVTYRVVDARKAVCASDDARQALYREAQLALRAVVGGRDLDALLSTRTWWRGRSRRCCDAGRASWDWKSSRRASAT